MDNVYLRQRLLLSSCLVLVVMLAWIYLLDMATDMPSMQMDMAAGMDMPMGMEMPAPLPGHLDFLYLFLMWSIMMVAMMLPSAVPMTITFLAFEQRRHAARRPTVRALLFVAGYVLAWLGFCVLATLAQWMLRNTMLSADMALVNTRMCAAILLGAGLYQWSAVKDKCLANCRTPLSFIMNHWRDGQWGAVRMGLAHGSYCVGCCWLLMALLFVSGVMNLFWITLLMIFVILEKLVPKGDLIGRAFGILLVGGGLLMMAGLL